VYSSYKGSTKEICQVKVGILRAATIETKKEYRHGLADNSNDSGDSNNYHFIQLYSWSDFWSEAGTITP
jgi:hypothetical protein